MENRIEHGDRLKGLLQFHPLSRYEARQLVVVPIPTASPVAANIWLGGGCQL